jgi:hypothetical protein
LSGRFARFVIVAQQSHVLGITQLQAQKESHDLDRLGASVDIIAERRVDDVWGGSEGRADGGWESIHKAGGEQIEEVGREGRPARTASRVSWRPSSSDQ